MKRISTWVLAVIVVAAVIASVASAQDSKMKNLKVLTGMPDVQVNAEMQAWTKALGVKCSHCHTLGDFASDENPKKETARTMAKMVMTVNKDFLKGEKKANCMLCHRGNAVPEEGGN